VRRAEPPRRRGGQQLRLPRPRRCQGLRFWDIRRLCKLYARVEPALFQCVSRGRRCSSYCQPCGQKYLDLARGRRPKELFAKAVYEADGARRLRSLKTSKYNEARYAALNLHSWLYRGTVECRMHQGTTNARKVVLWGVLWAGLLDYVARAGEAAIDALPADPFGALLAVAPTGEVREHLRERRETFTRAREDN
jgi:Putative amidoligase enzyme